MHQVECCLTMQALQLSSVCVNTEVEEWGKFLTRALHLHMFANVLHSTWGHDLPSQTEKYGIGHFRVVSLCAQSQENLFFFFFFLLEHLFSLQLYKNTQSF